MLSRYNLPRNVEKYLKSFNSLKANKKLNVKVFKQNVNVISSAVHDRIQKKFDIGVSFCNQKYATVNSIFKNNPKLLARLGISSAATQGNETPQVTSTTSSSITDLKTETIQQIPPDAVKQSPILDSSTISPDVIPEPPTIPVEEIGEIVQSVAANGEPTFASLGLGGWGPVGMVEQCLEYFHVVLDLPWWGAIAIGTVIVRALMFPLVVIAQRNAAKMNNYLPQLQVLQLKMTEARQTGNQIDAARYGQEMVLFMKEKNLNPLKNMIVPLAQMPLFVSFFMSLREMSNTPVQSMTTGGLFWFKDLTLPDQYFALPIVTSITMWLTIELGTDSAKLSSQNLQTMRYVLRALPLVILPFTVNFPGAILCYWVCTNFISLGQVGFLRIPKVREFFKIEHLVEHKSDQLPIKPKGFVKGLKESWTNMKITNEMEGRRRYDEMQFNRAGKGPIVKTYKYDPTKQTHKS